jgi:hypothetical protein
MAAAPKRPKDINQLAKMIVDISTEGNQHPKPKKKTKSTKK